MIKSLKSLATQAGFEYIGEDVSIETVSINSNAIKANSLFVAIVAIRDGHEFIPSAIANGAKALLVSKKQDNVDIPQIVCLNTIKSLRALAKEYRKSLKMPIISLTGSCGKTSVKEMMVTLLGNRKVHFTQGNLNNYLGVPMTILETPQDAEFTVIETGTSVGGEILAAAEIIQPDIAMITNVGASHLENLKTLDGVMTEKGELLKALSKDGTCIVNLDDQRIPSYANNLDCKKITCSMSNANADIFIKKYTINNDSYDIQISIFGKVYSYKIPAIGKHNLFNSIMAIASILATGLDPEEFLKNTANIQNYKGRFSSQKIANNLTLVDDTYNASATAVKAAIEDLAEFDGKKILVISSMRELGDEAENYHTQMGQWIAKANLDRVFLFGNNEDLDFTLLALKNDDRVKLYDSKDTLGTELLSFIELFKNQPTKIIVKGARFYEMEDFVKVVCHSVRLDHGI
jgi:UDP-N-acetylmuramoyl-tripeptide--D-alanyl-D-alanine ligase